MNFNRAYKSTVNGQYPDTLSGTSGHRQSTEKNKKPWIMDRGLWTKKKGFTLIELLVVLTILGFFVAMMAKVFTKQDDQRRFDETRIRMEEIKKAILGSEGAYAHGQRQFAGYVADMGGLPTLTDIGVDDPTDITVPIRKIQQPSSLWDRGGLTAWAYENQGNGSRIWGGWRGPYIESPLDNTLKDGWGNPFIFFEDSVPADTCSDITDRITALGGMQSGDMVLISLGANNACGDTDIFEEDIIIIVKQTDYTAPLAGRVTGFSDNGAVRVKMYVSNNGDETPITMDVGVPTDGYFRFEPRGATEPDPEAILSGRKYTSISIGLRSIIAYEGVFPGSPQVQVFTVEPTGNWLGDIEIQ